MKLNRAMSGEPDADYAKALTACKTLAELRALVDEFAELALDALPQVAAMTEADWPDFQRGLKAERRGKFAGEEWCGRFGAILMPLPMMTITQISTQWRWRVSRKSRRSRHRTTSLDMLARTAISVQTNAHVRSATGVGNAVLNCASIQTALCSPLAKNAVTKHVGLRCRAPLENRHEALLRARGDHDLPRGLSRV